MIVSARALLRQITKARGTFEYARQEFRWNARTAIQYAQASHIAFTHQTHFNDTVMRCEARGILEKVLDYRFHEFIACHRNDTIMNGGDETLALRGKYLFVGWQCC